MALSHSVASGFEELVSNPLRSALQLSGITLGVASVISALSLVAGEREHSLKLLEERGGLRRIDVRPKTAGWGDGLHAPKAPFSLDDLRAVSRELGDRIESVNAQVNASGRISHGRNARELSAVGVLPEYSRFNDFHPAAGRFLTWRDMDDAAPVCVLGSTLKQVLFGVDDAVGRTVRFRGLRLQVIGVMEEKEYYWMKGVPDNALEWMNRLLLVPLTTVQKKLLGQREIASFQVMAARLDDVSSLSTDLRTLLWRRHKRQEDFSLFVRQEQHERRMKTRMVYDLIFFGVGAISLAVGGIVIMNILLASLSARVREIGVRKALGAKGTDVFVQFLSEAVAVSLAGAAAGTLLGIAAAKIVSGAVVLHSAVAPWVVLMAAACAVGTGLGFGLYPAWKAARVPPVEALRYE